MALTNDRTRQIGRVVTPNLGSDPELFIATKGEVIGAEKVIPKTGLYKGPYASKNQIVLDGVQVELHPRPGTCRAQIANDFKGIFINLKAQLQKSGASASFNPVVEVKKEEMATLSKEAQQLGCAPSLNLHNPTASIKVPKNFRMRSAGGHIHISGQYYDLRGNYRNFNASREGIAMLVKVCDLFLGIPGVLLDPGPDAAVRRKVYGRASEHRVPSYGVEYRVLSNYWLRSYQLMSFVYGMARQACNVVGTQLTEYPGRNSWKAVDELMSRVDYEKVCKAINKNDVNLAWKQWEGIASFIDEFCVDNQSGLWSGESLEAFEFFAKKVQQFGMTYWFPEDPLEHWTTIPEGHTENAAGYAGWETYVLKAVAEKRADVLVDDVIARILNPQPVAEKKVTRKRVPKAAPTSAEAKVA